MQLTHPATTGAAVGSRRDQRDADFTDYLQARQPALLRTAYLLTGDWHQAEDILQTALAKLYLSWDKVRERDSMDGYVRRIMVNENNSSWRRSWRRREHPTDGTTGVLDSTPVVDRYDDGRDAAVWELVSTLPRKARAVVVLRYYEQLTEVETAEILGIAVGTVKSQSSRALAALRERTPSHLDPSQTEERS